MSYREVLPQGSLFIREKMATTRKKDVRLFGKVLDVQPETAERFISRNGGVSGAADVLIRNRGNSYLVNSASKRDALARSKYLEQLAPWAKKFACAKVFLEEASLLELRVTVEDNPTYPFLAFRVPLHACHDLATNILRREPSPDARLYATIVQHLLDRKQIDRAQLNGILVRSGLAEGACGVDPSALAPFDDAVLGKRRLTYEMTRELAPGEILKFNPGKGTALLRELEELRNRIVRVTFIDQEGVLQERFQLDEGAEELADMLETMLRVPLERPAKTSSKRARAMSTSH